MLAGSLQLHAGLNQGIVDNFQRILVEGADEIVRQIAVFIGFQQVVIETYFCRQGSLGGYPVNGALDLAAGSCAARLGIEVSRAAQLYDTALLVLDDFFTFDDISVFQTNLSARGFRRKNFLGASSMKSSCSM